MPNIKLDEGGKPVVVEGKVIVVDGDNEQQVDPIEYALEREKIATRANNESATRRKEIESLKARIKELEEKLQPYEGIEDPKLAKEAIETMGKLADKEKQWAIKLDEARKEARAQAAEEYGKKIKELEGVISTKDSIIHKKTISAAFGNSQYIAKELIIPPDMAEAVFGKYFSVDSATGELIVLDERGERMFSSSGPDYASFEEGLKYHIDRYPGKKSIMRGIPGGDANKGLQSGSSTEELTAASFYPTMKKQGG
jgi:hypothetical protein